MLDWRENAIAALDDARAEIMSANEPTIIVVLTIGEADLLRERPLSIYANQTTKWLQRVLAFAAWRLALKADEPPTATS